MFCQDCRPAANVLSMFSIFFNVFQCCQCFVKIVVQLRPILEKMVALCSCCTAAHMRVLPKMAVGSFSSNSNSYDKSHFSLALFYQSHFQFNSNVSKWDFQLLWNGRSPSGPRSCSSSVSTTNNGSIRPQTHLFSNFISFKFFAVTYSLFLHKK